MTVAIHKHGEQMYLIKDPARDGFLTWDHEDKRYLMGFTTSDKAEEYNDIVLRYRSGEIIIVTKRESMDLAKKMVAKGVHWMIVDYPVINDAEFQDENPIFDGIPRELGRHYTLVDLRGLVARK